MTLYHNNSGSRGGFYRPNRTKDPAMMRAVFVRADGEHTTADAIAKARWGLKFIASDPRPLAAVEAACAAWRDPSPANKKAAVKAGDECSRFHTSYHRVCFGRSIQLDAATAAACAAYAAGADNPDREAMCINGAMGAFPYQFPEQHAAYQDPKYYPASR